jgi:2-polyprenyl-3-methyl-5-hydroxy-6-metoxy-1,4-benzoquinol methylase
MDLDRVRDEWDSEADTFDQEPDHGMLQADTRAAWWTLLEAFFPAAPARIADLGCGTGTVAVLLAEHGYDVTGVDLSPKMIDLARTKARSAGLSVLFEVGNAAEPEAEAGAFDVVFARHVVWALPDPGAALERWAALLAPGGCFILVEGRWSTGAGLLAESMRALVLPLMTHVDVVPLSDPTLWGREIDDERYLLVAKP